VPSLMSSVAFWHHRRVVDSGAFVPPIAHRLFKAERAEIASKMARVGKMRLWVWLLVGTGVVAHSHGAETLLAQKCRWNAAGPLLPHEDSQSCPLIVDDETGGQTGQWRPWTHRPTCAYPQNTTEPKYCVFSFSPYCGGSGISLMTTPETAAEVVSLLEDPDWNWEPWTPNELSFGADGPPWEVVDIPNKGKGVVATRPIRRGETLMRDSAVLIGMLRPPSSMLAPHRLVILNRAYKQLPERQRDEVMALAASKGGPVLDDIMGTNIFGIPLAGRDGHMGLFPMISVGFDPARIPVVEALTIAADQS
jgi:hypothetical protein